MLNAPILAAKIQNIELIKFPVLATPKLDGIRCIKVNGQALSRSFKAIKNDYIRNLIESTCPDGFDGEIIAGQNFNDVQSLVMSRDGNPQFKYAVFDYVGSDLDEPYEIRVQNLQSFFKSNSKALEICDPVFPVTIHSPEELKAVMDCHINQGYEGTMVRSPQSPYKCGRSTLKEGYLLAIKPFVDDEAEIIGFEELMHNENKLEKDVFGYADRSSKKEGLVPGNTLGAFIVRGNDGVEFKIGTGRGLTKELRKNIWDNRQEYLGKLVHYRYQLHGSKDRPRIPVWHGFRDRDDL